MADMRRHQLGLREEHLRTKAAAFWKAHHPTDIMPRDLWRTVKAWEDRQRKRDEAARAAVEAAELTHAQGDG